MTARAPLPPSRLEDQLLSPRKILRAWVLLSLNDRPAHGYEIISRLGAVGFCGTPTQIYRALRSLEANGLVQPTWQTTGRGPARRVYTVAPLGLHTLDMIAPALGTKAAFLNPSMAGYVLTTLQALAGEMKVFSFTVHARLRVNANNEAAARHKLERVLGRVHRLHVDVETTGNVRIGRPEDGAHPATPPPKSDTGCAEGYNAELGAGPLTEKEPR